MGIESPGGQTDVLRVVEQALRVRMMWEEVCMAHWARPFDEVLGALTVAADKWGVEADRAFIERAALQIYAGSWE